MEVHHPSHHERKKNWRSYFWEFLMLFLAVSLGFFVENLREHYVERSRAAELAKSLYEDLKKDTIALNAGIRFGEKKINGADDLLAMLHGPREQMKDTAFYRSMLSVIAASPFVSTDGTYSQVKASGALRYFDQSLVNRMNAYSVQNQKSKMRDEVEEKSTKSMADFLLDVINFEIIFDLRFNQPITHDMFIKIADKAAREKLINHIVIIKTFRMRTLQEYKSQLDIAEKLLDEVKKEYHLE